MLDKLDKLEDFLNFLIDKLDDFLNFLIGFFQKFPDLVSSKYFWICISVFGCVSGLLIYFCP